MKVLQYSQENTCVGVSLMKLQVFRPTTLLKRDSNTRVFFCKYCEIFKKIYFKEHMQTAASDGAMA